MNKNLKKMPKVRLFVEQKLSLDAEVILNQAQSHYLSNVLRMSVEEELKCFDNQSGEYIAKISESTKKACMVKIIGQTRVFEQSPDIWLLFAPVKKDKTDFIIASATELGVRKIMPVITRRTISEKIKKERYQAQVIEAAEQSRRVDIPSVEDAEALEKILKNWDESRILYFMDETGNGEDIRKVFAQSGKKPAAILIGPEGGFDEDELDNLRKLPFAKGVSMGKRILRAETAVAAALSCWQALAGDWDKTSTEGEI